ncbi:MAG: efflux RND transporter periplasmic adaptor subunit, partial [Minicystis sp.]
GAEAGAVAPIPIESPMSGLLQRVHALPGQVVHAGAPLVEIARYDPIWIRVPVYVGDLFSTDLDRPALIAGLTGLRDEAPRTARPVMAPPSANPGTATVDLFYELSNAGGELRPGHSVSATLPSLREEESLVVPWAAVLHDIHGGSWVYENSAAHVYVRRRVQVRHVVGAQAVLASGPKPGTLVVTDGAAELFGTEFGTGK